MATVNFKAHKHHLKSDGTINIKLVIYHKGKRVYPDTNHFVTLKQLKKNFDFKDGDLIATLTTELGEYRKIISGINRVALNGMTAGQLSEILMPTGSSIPEYIDLVSFAYQFAHEYYDSNQLSYSNSIKSAINNFKEFMGTDVVYTSDVTPDVLRGFIKYLKTARTQTRKSRNGELTLTRSPLADSSLVRVINVLKHIFNGAKDKYNDEDNDIIRIKNSPFKKIKLKSVAPKKDRALPLETVRLIRDCPVRINSIAELARDIDMLSFYLCGINAKDLYVLTEKNIVGDRLEYKRSKTRNKRSDDAFISIKIIEEARPLLHKWINKLSDRYKTSTILNISLYRGNAQLVDIISKEHPSVFNQESSLEFYSLRHTFATEARNTLGYSLSDVGEALNHTAASITDTYIKRDWSLVDKIQRGVVDLLNKDRTI